MGLGGREVPVAFGDDRRQPAGHRDLRRAAGRGQQALAERAGAVELLGVVVEAEQLVGHGAGHLRVVQAGHGPAQPVRVAGRVGRCVQHGHRGVAGVLVVEAIGDPAELPQQRLVGPGALVVGDVVAAPLQAGGRAQVGQRRSEDIERRGLLQQQTQQQILGRDRQAGLVDLLVVDPPQPVGEHVVRRWLVGHWQTSHRHLAVRPDPHRQHTAGLELIQPPVRAAPADLAVLTEMDRDRRATGQPHVVTAGEADQVHADIQHPDLAFGRRQPVGQHRLGGQVRDMHPTVAGQQGKRPVALAQHVADPIQQSAGQLVAGRAAQAVQRELVGFLDLDPLPVAHHLHQRRLQLVRGR